VVGQQVLKNANMNRTRYFEVLRDKGNDPHQRTAYRDFSLVDAVASKIDVCRASQALYRAPLWGWLAGDEPRLLSIHRWVEEQLARRGYVRFSRRDVELWQFAFPRSRLLDWSQHEMQWQLHDWGATFDDLSLVAALLLEARLSGALDVVKRWSFPLEQHLEISLREDWIREHGTSPAVKQFRELVLGLISPPLGSALRLRSVVRNMWAIHNPPLSVSGDVAWLLANEKRLKHVDENWFEMGEAEAKKALDGILTKRALFNVQSSGRRIRTPQYGISF